MSGRDGPRPLLRAGEASRDWLLGGVLAVLLLAALHAASAVAVVVIGAFFAALLVLPVDRAVRAAVPAPLGWLGHLAALLALLAGLVVLGGALAYCVTRVGAAFQPLASGGLPTLLGGGDGEGGPVRRALSALDLEVSTLLARATGQASAIIMGLLSNAVGVVSGVVLIVFVALMALVEAPRWDRRLALATGRHQAWREGVEVLGRHVRRFALVRLVLGLVTAALYGAWIWLMGVDLVWTWMILAVALNFVPTLGSIVAGVLPVVYAAFTRDAGTALALAAGLLAIEQVMGNFVDPRVAGREVAVSPVVVLVSLLVWGFVLGPAGTLLATPLTIAAMILAARVEPLRPLGLMLSDCDDWDDFETATREAA